MVNSFVSGLAPYHENIYLDTGNDSEMMRRGALKKIQGYESMTTRCKLEPFGREFLVLFQFYVYKVKDIVPFFLTGAKTSARTARKELHLRAGHGFRSVYKLEHKINILMNKNHVLLSNEASLGY
jgi:hypothetical protein